MPLPALNVNLVSPTLADEGLRRYTANETRGITSVLNTALCSTPTPPLTYARLATDARASTNAPPLSRVSAASFALAALNACSRSHRAPPEITTFDVA